MKKGFTLAEVLTTLGIIGIVVMMTIPILQKIQDNQFKEAAKEAFSKASQVVEQIRLDSDGTLNAYYGTSRINLFKNVFMPYFKVVQDCNWSDCVPAVTTSDIYTSLTKAKANTKNFGSGQFITADGMFWALKNYTTPREIEIYVDVNGYGKGPNVYGRDVFGFQIVNDNLFPLGATITNCSDYCNRTPSWRDATQGLCCMNNVMQGIDY